MRSDKRERILEIFFRGLRGEELSVAEMANEYDVSQKSISRDINDIKAFLVNHRELVGNAEFEYLNASRRYRLRIDEFLKSQELFALIEVIIGTRAFPKNELVTMTEKLKRFTTVNDRGKLKKLINNEICQYAEVGHDCENVCETLWQLADVISEKHEISIEYHKADRTRKTYRLRPVSLMFADSYFYMIAFEAGDEAIPKYFRVDRVTEIIQHHERFTSKDAPDFDEGLLRRRSLFMWPGKLRTIRFEYTGISYQAALDKLPSAKIVDKCPGGYIIEAEVYGDGIMMWLLSQGEWVRVISPPDFVEEYKRKLKAMLKKYGD